jgi:hypothetical protein
MLIIAGYAEVDASKRDDYVAATMTSSCAAATRPGWRRVWTNEQWSLDLRKPGHGT